jgi:hypothetical protein
MIEELFNKIHDILYFFNKIHDIRNYNFHYSNYFCIDIFVYRKLAQNGHIGYDSYTYVKFPLFEALAKR